MVALRDVEIRKKSHLYSDWLHHNVISQATDGRLSLKKRRKRELRVKTGFFLFLPRNDKIGTVVSANEYKEKLCCHDVFPTKLTGKVGI